MGVGLVGIRERQVRIEGLREFYLVLVRVLRGMELTEAERVEVLSKHIGARCVLCGMQLTGEELGAIAAVGCADHSISAKLKRITQGYCARRECDSYYYQVDFQGHSKVDWAEVLSQMNSGETEVVEVAEEEPVEEPELPEVRLERRRLRLKIGVIVSCLLLFLLYRHWVNGGSIPWLRPKHVYTLDPSSLAPPPAAGGNAESARVGK